MSDDIELDDFDLDDDLDLDLDLGLDDPPPVVTQGREAVIETASIAGKEAAKKVLGKGKERQLITKALPKEYGEALGSYDKLAETGTDLIETARDEFRKTAQTMKRVSKQSAPLIKKYLPKKLGDKLDKLLEDTSDETGRYTSENESPEDSAIAHSMEALTVATAESQKREEAGEARDEIREQIDAVRGDNANKLLGLIAEHTSKIKQYDEVITNAYQRKMLELQYRQYFAQRDLLSVSKEHFDKMSVDIAAIVKNTALPDYAKEQFGEITRALMQRETIQRLLPGQYAANYLSEFGKNAKSQLTEAMSGFRSTAMELGDGLEMLSAGEAEQDLTPEQMAAQQRRDAAKMAGGQLAERLVNPYRDKLLRKVRKAGEGNDDVSNFGRRAAYELGTVPELLNTIAGGEKTGTFLDNFSDAIQLLAPTMSSGLSVQSNSKEALEAASKFDKRSYLTLNDVIPGLLRQIDESVRKGNGDDSPAPVYDFGTGGFIDPSAATELVSKSIGGEQEKAARRDYINQLVDKVDKDKLLDSDERTQLGQLIESKAKEVKRFDLNTLLEDSNDLNFEVVDKLKETYSSKTARDNMNYEMKSGIQSLRSSYTDKQEVLEGLTARFGNQVLQEAGVLTNQGKGFEVNRSIEDTYASFDPVAETVKGVAAASAAVQQPISQPKPNTDESKTESRTSPFDRKPSIKEDCVKAVTKLFERYHSTERRRNDFGPLFDNIKVNTSEATPQAKPIDNIFDSRFKDLSPEEQKEVIRKGPASVQTERKHDAFFERLGNLYNEHHSDEARMRALQPVVDAIRASLEETSTKPEVTAILQVLQEMSANGVGGEAGEGGSKSKFFSKINDAVAWSKGKLGGAVKGIFGVGKGVFSKIRNTFTSAMSNIGKLNEFRANLTANVGNAIKRVIGTADIYDDEGNLFLSGKIMRNGGYFDSEGKPIKSIKDIKGAIYDANGEVVVSLDEVKSKINNLSFNRGGRLERVVGATLGKAGETARSVVTKVSGIGKGAFEKVREVGRAIKADDVYVQGEDSPRLTRNLMAKGFYVNRDGKAIYTVDDIDGEVLDSDGNVIISQAELSDPEKQLVNKHGKPFRGAIERIKDGIASAFKVGKRIASTAAGYAGKGATAIKDAVTGKFSFGKGVSDEAIVKSTEDTVNWLIKIYNLLDRRLNDPGSTRPEPNDFDGGPDTFSSKVSSAFDSTKDKAEEVKAEAERRAKAVKESVKAAFDEHEVSDKVQSGKEKGEEALQDAAEALSNVTDTLKESVKAQSEKAKGVFGDTDGDGIRDGSFRDRLKNREAKEESKPKAEAKQKPEKGGMGKLISMLSGVLVPLASKITGFFTGFKDTLGGLVTSVLSKVGMGKVATDAATAAAGASAASKAGKGSVLARGAKAVGRGALGAAKLAGRAGLYLLRGLTALNPVSLGITAVAAIAYGGYRLATRTEHLDRVRYAMYGTDNYTHGKGDDVKKIAYLEESLSKHLSYSNGFSNLRGIGESEVATIASGMGVDVQSPEPYRQWQLWFKDRFLPVYLLWTTRSYQYFPDKKLSEISSTDDYRSQLKVLQGTNLDQGHRAFAVTETPFDDTIELEDLFELRAEVEEYLTEEAEDQPKKSDKETYGKTPKATSTDVAANASRVANTPVEGSKPKTNNVLPKDIKVGDNETVQTVIEPDKARDTTAVNILESIRLQTYGLMYLTQGKVGTLYRLEDYMAKRVVVSGNVVNVEYSLKEVFDKFSADFGLERDNEEHLQNFNIWLVSRFIPTFNAFYQASNQHAKGLDPLTLIISSSNAYLGKIAKAIVAAKDSSGRSVWAVTTSPWADGKPLTASTMLVMGRVRKLVELVESKAVTEHKLASEVESRQVEVIKQDIRTSKRVTAGDLADRYLAESGNSYRPSNTSDILPNTNTTLPPPTTRVTEVDESVVDQNTAYGKLMGYGTSREEVANLLKEVSKYTGIDPTTLGTVAMIESSMNPQAAAGTSSAKGLYQFINSTWKSMMGKDGSKYGIPANASPFDPAANALLGAEYLKESQKAAASVINYDPTVTDIYMGHFLGQGGMRKFFTKMQKDPNRVAALDFKAAARANPRIFAKGGRPLKYSEVYGEMARKTRTNASHAMRYLGAIGGPETMLAQTEVPNVDTMPGKREAIAQRRTEREVNMAADAQVARLSPGSVSSTEVVAKTNEVLNDNVGSINDAKDVSRKAVAVARAETKSTVAAKEARTASVNVEALKSSHNHTEILTAQLRVQEASDAKLASISDLLAQIANNRDSGGHSASPNKRSPLEVTHGKGAISTSRKRMS